MLFANACSDIPLEGMPKAASEDGTTRGGESSGATSILETSDGVVPSEATDADASPDGADVVGTSTSNGDVSDEDFATSASSTGSVLEATSSEGDATTSDPGDLLVVGCADGRREAFLDLTVFDRIAGCAGAWTVRGLLVDVGPTCGRRGGNNGPTPMGGGCSVEDVCAEGWHVCLDASEVEDRSPSGCSGASDPTLDDAFYVTRQNGSGSGVCGEEGADDLFGCGTIGLESLDDSCAPLDRALNREACLEIRRNGDAPWNCDTQGDADEANALIKLNSNLGGALCCAD